MQLDSDDEYKADFLRESISFMTQYDCDVACRGNNFIDSQSERIVGKRQLANDLIIDSKESYSGNLPAYYQFMRDLWGKKYILSRIQKADVDLSDKLKILDQIFSDDMTRHILKCWYEVGIYSNKDEFLYEIKDWIKMQNGWEKERFTIENIISSMNV